MWRRIRKHSPRDRNLEFVSGTRLSIQKTDFIVRWISRERQFQLEYQNTVHSIKGSWSISGHCKPLIYFDELQIATDSLIVESILFK